MLLHRVHRVALVLVLVMFVSGCYLAHERPTDAGPPTDSPRRCPPMDIRSPAECTWGPPAFWWWNGSTCTEGMCVCAGADCGSTFTTEAACTAAHADCAL